MRILCRPFRIGFRIVSDTIGTARSGDVAVHAKTVILREGAVIQTGTSIKTGAGGNVAIDADSVDISGEARIVSLSAIGDAGKVAITADALTMNNVSIESSTSSSGQGGDVALNVGSVSLSNGAKINSSTSEAGRAGDIDDECRHTEPCQRQQHQQCQYRDGRRHQSRRWHDSRRRARQGM